MRNLTDPEGWKRPIADDEDPHTTFVDHGRYRVICRSCPWHYVRLGASAQDLRLMGRQHRSNMRVPEAG